MATDLMIERFTLMYNERQRDMKNLLLVFVCSMVAISTLYAQKGTFTIDDTPSGQSAIMDVQSRSLTITDSSI